MERPGTCSCLWPGILSERMDCMERGFSVDYEGTPFLETSKTAAHSNRLNWRCEILLTRNREAIEGKKILDLASHDGRFSYACLELGASHVTGVEGRHHLVESANENLTGLGYKPERFSFVEDDAFDYLHGVKPGEFDTILCFGFFYHTVRQNELLGEIKRIQATHFVLDSHIARGLFIVRPQRFRYTEQGAYPRVRTNLLARLNPRVQLGRLVRTSARLKQVAEEALTPGKGKPCLVFRAEDHVLEGATIDPIDLVAWPTKSFIELVFRSYGFSFKELKWSDKEIKDWTALEDYRAGERVSYIGERL